MNKLTISIFGLGYVGIVSSACFARDGISVLGVDVDQKKVDLINNGESPIVENGLGELLASGVQNKMVKATTDYTYAVMNSQVSIVCVGTPSREDGALDLKYVFRVCEQIGEVLKSKKEPHTIIIRSTVIPGTTEKCQQIINEHSGGSHFVGFNPEFLREGTAIHDFDDPPYTVVGTKHDEVKKVIEQLYATVDAPLHVMDAAEAELVKYTANAWHATKVNFANEIGRIAKSNNVNGRTVMEIISSDKKLNISEVYMKPGFAYGGSCLPKDVRALDYYSKINNISLPLISSLSKSNNSHLDFVLDTIMRKGYKKIGMLGLAFKAGTDDLRESPAVELAERLIGKGCSVKIMDPAVQETKLTGSNKEYIENKIPHLFALMVKSSQELLDHSDLIVVTHGAAEFREVLTERKEKTKILDLTGIYKNFITAEAKVHYEGICW
jgi:GDP-mannose 6-dehydrogenase